MIFPYHCGTTMQVLGEQVGQQQLTKLQEEAGTEDDWVALVNPYTFNLDIATFLSQQDSDVQGGVVYTWTGTNFVANVQGEIKVTDGFILNYATSGEKTITFKEKQGRWYNTTQTQSKSTTAREFVTLTMMDGELGIDLLFANNEEATQAYDIFDANKMFSTTGITEPYFVTDCIALVKEEVDQLPYYATMNVRSDEAKDMKFVANNIPEGLAVSIIDGENVIDMIEGSVYETSIASGENANRFKVLIKKNVGLSDVKELNVTITNSNRYIAISTQENMKVSVQNTLGQMVYETVETNFELNGIASDSYIVKVQGDQVSKSQKIVVK